MKVKLYFYRLGYALIGRDSYAKERDAFLKERDKLVRELQETMAKADKLQELYEAALEQWQNTAKLELEVESKCKKEIASYQALVETLRGTIRDKDTELDRVQKAYRDLQVSTLKIPEEGKDKD